ncbi:MAG TPA: selenide, water dikinase SelD [Planctomycetes bacterium]|nr:selenide, water dikinase SelD [Planctomycetota bacterium]
MPQGELAQVLQRIAPAASSDALLAGPNGFDDSGAVRLGNGRVGLHTVDFFPPVVDDPAAYGEIAAANALSDIYACGGEPKVVLNIAGFPEEWGKEIVLPIVDAAVAKVAESGAIWAGGHTVRSKEPLFGFAVFGEVAEDALVTNAGARPGDLLFLTKPLGCGPLNTAVKRGSADPGHVAAACAGMARLNAAAGAALLASGSKAATDVTGFGLMGHAANLAKASDVGLDIKAVALPLYEGAAELAAADVFSGSSMRGRQTLEGIVEISSSVPSWLASLCFDAETSGGILACVPGNGRSAFEAAFPEDCPPVFVGEVVEGLPCVRLG